VFSTIAGAHWLVSPPTKQELLDRQAAAEKASETIVQVATMSQPAADLLISLTPGVRPLVDAAVAVRPRAEAPLPPLLVGPHVLR
jgi:hypothetical protein